MEAILDPSTALNFKGKNIITGLANNSELTCDVVLLVVVGVRHGMQRPRGPSPVSTLLVVVAAPIGLLAEEVHLLPPVQVPGRIERDTQITLRRQVTTTLT